MSSKTKEAARDAGHVACGSLAAGIMTVVLALLLSGCASPSAVAIYERERLTAQASVTSEINADDIERYIVANAQAALERANRETHNEYALRLSVARSPEEGASLMAQFAEGLNANRDAFLNEVEIQFVMVERQRLVGHALDAVNRMASKEATAARRAFDLFVENELPRIMEEARAGLAEIAAHQERERIRKEAERAQKEAERKQREQEERDREEHQEPPAPTPTPAPTEPGETR